MRSVKSHTIRNWVEILFGEQNRLAVIPVDVRRWVIMPMVLAPARIVASNGHTFMIRVGERCYIDGLRVELGSTFGATESGWVIGTGTSVVMCGVHGSYAGIDAGGTLLMQNLPIVAARLGADVYMTRPEGDEWEANESTEGVTANIDAPAEYDRIVYAEDAEPWEFLLWDGARGLCKCREIPPYEEESWNSDEDEYVTKPPPPPPPVTLYTLPWTPVSICGSPPGCIATAPWGERHIFYTTVLP